MVKVGDKVRIVSVNGDYAGYKNGEVLEVISLNIINQKNIYVRTNKDVGYTGAGSDRPIQQPFAYLIESEYEVVPNIRKGDTVKLIDRFYEHEAFKRLVRYRRKDIANQSGKELKILEINCGRVRYSAKDDGWWAIPVELLEKVEPRLVGKSFSYSCIDELFTTKHRYTAEQIAEAERIIGEIVATENKIRTVKLERNGNHTTVYTGNGYYFECFGGATCSPHDEFNRTIGVMVALCKAVGRKLPEWI